MAFDTATQGRSASPHPLPSLPPSPSEADLGRRGAWDEHDDDDDDEYDEFETEPRTPTAHSAQGRAPNAHNVTKGKGKGSAGPLEATYADGGTDEALREIDGAQEHYPPTTDGDAETRRIEEVRCARRPNPAPHASRAVHALTPRIHPRFSLATAFRNAPTHACTRTY